jgi:hypothetical protein
MNRTNLITLLWLIGVTLACYCCQIILVEPAAYLIPQGRHNGLPDLGGSVAGRGQSLTYQVRFTASCRYSVPSQTSWNKLFGIGYVDATPSPHRINSARWGWRYNPATDQMEVCAYSYVARQRITDQFICPVAIGQTIDLYLWPDFSTHRYVYAIRHKGGDWQYHYVSFRHDKLLAFRLGVYFGGPDPAPHSMVIEMRPL